MGRGAAGARRKDVGAQLLRAACAWCSARPRSGCGTSPPARDTAGDTAGDTATCEGPEVLLVLSPLGAPVSHDAADGRWATHVRLDPQGTTGGSQGQGVLILMSVASAVVSCLPVSPALGFLAPRASQSLSFGRILEASSAPRRPGGKRLGREPRPCPRMPVVTRPGQDPAETPLRGWRWADRLLGWVRGGLWGPRLAWCRCLTVTCPFGGHSHWPEVPPLIRGEADSQAQVKGARKWQFPSWAGPAPGVSCQRPRRVSLGFHSTPSWIGRKEERLLKLGGGMSDPGMRGQ